jgi:hypothetical protein
MRPGEMLAHFNKCVAVPVGSAVVVLASGSRLVVLPAVSLGMDALASIIVCGSLGYAMDAACRVPAAAPYLRFEGTASEYMYLTFLIYFRRNRHAPRHALRCLVRVVPKFVTSLLRLGM